MIKIFEANESRHPFNAIQTILDKKVTRFLFIEDNLLTLNLFDEGFKLCHMNSNWQDLK